MSRNQRPGRVRVAALAVCFLLAFVSNASASERTDIGYSVDGRPIVAVHEDSADPALKVVAFGCIHGDETAGMRVARRLVAAGAPRGVDLNRNFPFDWTHRSGGDPFVERRFADLIGLPLVRLHGRYPGSATRWQNHSDPRATAFVTELPAMVSGALVRRATAAVRTLAAELASPALAVAEANSARRGAGTQAGKAAITQPTRPTRSSRPPSKSG